MTLPSFLAVHILIASLHEVLGKKKRKNEDKKKRKIGKKKRGDTIIKEEHVSIPRDAERSKINS